MGRKEANDLRESFRSSRGQSQVAQRQDFSQKKNNVDNSVESVNKFRKSSTSRDSLEKSFYQKLNNLELRIDSFTPLDLVYYFREMSRKNGYHYVITNTKAAVGSMRRALKDRNAREICTMIEFIFESNQDYINKEEVQPTIISSRFSVKIYADVLLWVEDKYIPSSQKKKKGLKKVTKYTPEPKKESLVPVYGKRDEYK